MLLPQGSLTYQVNGRMNTKGMTEWLRFPSKRRWHHYKAFEEHFVLSNSSSIYHTTFLIVRTTSPECTYHKKTFIRPLFQQQSSIVCSISLHLTGLSGSHSLHYHNRSQCFNREPNRLIRKIPSKVCGKWRSRTGHDFYRTQQKWTNGRWKSENWRGECQIATSPETNHA